MSEELDRALDRAVTPAWSVTITPTADGQFTAKVQGGLHPEDLPILLLDAALRFAQAQRAERAKDPPLIQMPTIQLRPRVNGG